MVRPPFATALQSAAVLITFVLSFVFPRSAGIESHYLALYVAIFVSVLGISDWPSPFYQRLVVFISSGNNWVAVVLHCNSSNGQSFSSWKE
jgi:hypothetical protein